MILHGAGGILFDGPAMRRVARRLAASGVDAYVIHYFDGSGVAFTPSDRVLGEHYEEWLAVIRDAVNFVRTRQGMPARPVVLYGYSMGAFLGIAASSNNPEIGALAEQSGGVWDNQMSRIGRMPPTLIIHGREDARVPFAKYEVPFEAALRKKRVRYRTLILDHEGHVFSLAAQIRAADEVAAFIGDEERAGKLSAGAGEPIQPGSQKSN